MCVQKVGVENRFLFTSSDIVLIKLSVHQIIIVSEEFDI